MGGGAGGLTVCCEGLHWMQDKGGSQRGINVLTP
jgi:hypothetical protein